LSEHNLKPEMKGTVKSVEENEKKTKAPKLFKLGGIQKVANKKWNYSLSETLDIVQALYDKGFLSYPRTDSTYITQSEFDYLKDHIETYSDLLDLNFETKHLEPRKEYVNGDKVLEHYAIVPTKSVPAKE
ncbi:TPA: type IA DNA topoisomerase, partial [Staphylococcus pseudintermedius]|nr:type IA DNA topoisomerase [Staphylococcus pseudintermedius]